MSLYDVFFANRADQIAAIESLDKRHSLRLINKLVNEIDRTAFLSTISEVRFAQFFDSQCTTIKHEDKLDGRTPDLLLSMNGQDVLAEVAKLNPSEQDRLELDFDDSIFDALHEIQIGCWIHFSYNDKTIDRKSIDVSFCKEEISKWLAHPRMIGDSLLLFNSLLFKLKSINDELEHVCLSGGGGSVHFDYRRLSSENSALLRKAKKYNDIITKHNLPYIVCFHMDFQTWFSERDLYNALYGLSCGNYDEMNNLTHSSLIEQALYYLPNRPMANVSGVLLYTNGKFTYYHNYSDQRLNSLNKAWLMSFKWSD